MESALVLASAPWGFAKSRTCGSHSHSSLGLSLPTCKMRRCNFKTLGTFPSF